MVMGFKNPCTEGRLQTSYEMHVSKERRQLKIFLTQFGSALPLTPDPPIRLHDDKKVERS
jgi:hypothetical protein